MRRGPVIGIVVGLVVVLGGVGLALALSGGDDNDTASTTTTSTTAGTAPATSGTESTAVTIGIVCSTPEDAVHSVVDAWIAGDKAATQRCASDAVVTELFKASGAGAMWTFQGCQGDPGVPECAFSYEGGGAFFTLNGTEAEGWKAVSLSYVAD